MRVRVVAALLLAGCTGSGEPNLFHSGQRLRARVLVGEDGSRFLRGWVDTELGFDCDFAEVEGRLRCVPQEAAGLDYFADASCTVQATGSVGGAPAYVYERLDPGCWRGPRRYFRASALRTGPIYSATPDGCVQVDDNPHAVAGEPVAADTFVGLTTELVSGGDRVQARLWRSDDGAWMVMGGRDRDRRRDVVAWNGDPATWVPAAAAYSFNDFGDAACTRPVASLYDLCEPPAVILHYAQVDGCWQSRLFEVGEVRPSDTPTYASSGGQCIVDEWAAPLSYELGAPLAPIPATTVEVGGTRLRSEAAVAGDHAVTVGPVIDTAFGAPCGPGIAADGRERCLPEGAEIGYFRDPACAEPVAWVGYSASCEQPAPRYAGAWQDPDGRRRIYHLAPDSFTASELYVRDDPSCRAIDGTGSLWARVEAEIPATDFVPVGVLVE